jgi:hypothetical protein
MGAASPPDRVVAREDWLAVAIGLEGRVILKLYSLFTTDRQWADADASSFDNNHASLL